MPHHCTRNLLSSQRRKHTTEGATESSLGSGVDVAAGSAATTRAVAEAVGSVVAGVLAGDEVGGGDGVRTAGAPRITWRSQCCSVSAGRVVSLVKS